MLLSEFMDFIWARDKDECNEGLQILAWEGPGKTTYQNLLLSEDKWGALKWLRQFLDGDVELNHKIRFTPAESDSLDGHIIDFHGKKYRLQEVQT